ncbi:hypothetical protein [Virgibacillus sp. W0181]|uniref:hypothetical protein n=1 Tax=Virgibacillus sp. W0181 TaxID=3391581 RepID=UPI003F6E4103
MQIFLWNVTQRKLWQSVVILEEEKISVGYGYGSNKTVAARKAEEKLEDRLLQTELD